MIYAAEAEKATTLNIDTHQDKQEQYVLSDEEITTLGNWALLIEQHYKKPMDIEWAKDGLTNELFITQARPETVHQNKTSTYMLNINYRKGKVCAQGNAVGSKIKVWPRCSFKLPKRCKRIDVRFNYNY